ncbi:molybdopterin-guanine dinucleotide biosynthesis protein MobB [Actinobacillus pleuropneumoniae]|uniref:molybdopterin-guanine dinucleotide biosynthesis protein MobB n=1 Tax=Actinobacillus pleuropneumoniae TaxID=715 RepID=UPI003F7CAFCE
MFRHLHLANGVASFIPIFSNAKKCCGRFLRAKSCFSKDEYLCRFGKCEFNERRAKIIGHYRYSGTAKLPYWEKLIPKLTACQIKVGLIKHSHHNVEVHKPAKITTCLRVAGANLRLLVCL